MNFNDVCSDEGYRAEGFTEEEIPKIRRSDILFNLYLIRGLNENEEAEYNKLVKELYL